jgi:hypothetical protein
LSAPHIYGATLILGCALVLTGATLYMWVKDPKGRVIFGQPPREWLRLVGEHQRMWRWSTVPFLAGPIITLMGQAGLAALLRGAGDPGFAEIGLLATGFGALLWVINLAARLTVDPWAAKALAASGEVPESYTAVSLWTSTLYVIYTNLTFAGLSLYGAAILTSTLLPAWAGWLAMVGGALGLAEFAILRDAPPFMHYLIPIVIGVLLLMV